MVAEFVEYECDNACVFLLNYNESGGELSRRVES